MLFREGNSNENFQNFLTTPHRLPEPQGNFSTERKIDLLLYRNVN